MKSLLVTSAASSARFAFRFHPAIVRALLPPGVIGCYILSVGDNPIYVGRSDTCLRRRLSSHGMLGAATHFLWQPCDKPMAAFYLESAWYHHLGHRHPLMNINHPDRPSGAQLDCPFCTPGDIRALDFALARQRCVN